MIVQILILILGFVILIKGADIFVDGASNIAANFKVSKMLIGLTIVAFGTSAPELAVSIKSMLNGTNDILIGNVIGSNILNILLILGLSSVIYPLKVKSETLKKELPVLLIMTTLISILFCDSLFNSNRINTITRMDSILIVIIFIIFIYNLIKNSLKDKKESKEKEKPKYKLIYAIIFTIIGISAIIIGSNTVVDSAVKIAKQLKISESIISLTIVALGTSLPELMTSIVASKKKETDIAIGNIIGSNIFNIGVVLALPVLIFGKVQSIGFNYLDIIVFLISAVLLFIFSYSNKKIDKKEGLILLLIFVMYYSYRILV